MSDQSYRVVFVGEVEEGKDPEVVKSQLAMLGLLSPEDAGRMQPGKPIVLESGLGKEQALQFQSALKATGARCRLIPGPGAGPAVAEPPAPPPVAEAPPPPPVAPGDSSWGLDSEVASSAPAPPPELKKEAKQMTCPKCGFEQDEAAECMACGVIVGKFTQRQETGEADSFAADASLQGAEAMNESDMFQGTMHDGATVQAAHAGSGADEGFFAPEKRGIEKGILGGLTMMTIAGVWFGLGWMAGYIFFYPPVLFVIGLFAVLKGVFPGNVAGG